MRRRFSICIRIFTVAVLATGLGVYFSDSVPPARAESGGQLDDQGSPDASAADAAARAAGKKAQQNTLPLPMSPEFTTAKFNTFLFTRKYAETTKDGKPGLGWCMDEGANKIVPIRDTGPWIDGQYYGTHPAVRIYYSPRVMYWLTGDPDFWPQGKAAGLAKRPSKNNFSGLTY